MALSISVLFGSLLKRVPYYEPFELFAMRPLVWCGVVWCGVVWCGVVWCGVTQEQYDFFQ